MERSGLCLRHPPAPTCVCYDARQTAVLPLAACSAFMPVAGISSVCRTTVMTNRIIGLCHVPVASLSIHFRHQERSLIPIDDLVGL